MASTKNSIELTNLVVFFFTVNTFWSMIPLTTKKMIHSNLHWERHGYSNLNWAMGWLVTNWWQHYTQVCISNNFVLNKKPILSHWFCQNFQCKTVLNSLALAVNVNRKSLLPMISDTIRIMFKPKTPFWTGRAMDFLFDGMIQPAFCEWFDNFFLFEGISIDCSSSNFKVRAICAVFEAGENAAIQQVVGDETKFKFSLLGSVRK